MGWKDLHLDVPLCDSTALHIVLLHSDHWLRRQRVVAGDGLTLNLPQISYKGMALLTAICPAGESASSEGELKAVFHRFSDVDNGILVLGARRTRSDGSSRERCANLRLFSLELIERRGHLTRRVNLEVIRSLEWMREHRVRLGESVFLDEPKAGLRGRAKVRGIRPCPPREQWSDKLQVGEFKPWPMRVGDLKIASESKTIGVTPRHPIWSVDQNDFIPAGRLEPGERVKILGGETVVEWYVMRDEPVNAVYNIEVEGDHVYRVGESGLLVHNHSADPIYCRPGCDVTFPVGLLPAPNPTGLVSVRITATKQLSNKDGVYVKRHFMKIKAGKAFKFRARYSLSNPEGDCPIWYELARTLTAAPTGLNPPLTSAEIAYWSASRQRRFDEAYLDALIPTADLYTADRSTGPLDPVRWRTQRRIFGYGSLPDNFVRDSDD